MIDEFIRPSNRSVHDNLSKLTGLQMRKLRDILHEMSPFVGSALLESVMIDDDNKVNYTITLSGSYD